VSEGIERFGHGGDVWTAELVLGVPKEQLLDFSANINPLGPPASMRAAIRENLARITAYPDPKSRELKTVLARKLALGVDHLLIGNGAAEILYGIMRALRPQKVGLLQPCFSEYAEAASVVDAEFVTVFAKPEHGFAPPIDELVAACEETDLFVIGHPNNPNGRLLPLAGLVQMADALQRRGSYLLVDEAFYDFVPNAGTLLEQLDEWPNVILLRSLTKFYSIPGLRLGYAVARPELIRRIERELAPWGVNALAQAAGMAGLFDEEFERATLAWLREERPFVLQGLKNIPGVQPFEGEVNFVLFRCETPELQKWLGQRGILIRSCAAYPGLGSDYYRVAVRSREDNLRLLAAIAQAVEEV
jgi:threonine-phosphate decarboxylase